MREPKDVCLYKFEEGGQRAMKTALCWGKNRLHIDGFIKTPKGYHLQFKKRRLIPKYLFTLLPKNAGIRGITLRPKFAPERGLAVSAGGNTYHIPLFLRYSYDRQRGENPSKKEFKDKIAAQIAGQMTIEVDEYAKDREGNLIYESKLTQPALKDIIYFPDDVGSFDKERFIEEFSDDIQKNLEDEIVSMYKEMDSGIHVEDITSSWAWYMTVRKDNIEHTYRIPDGEVPDNGKEYQFWYAGKEFGWVRLYKGYTDHIYGGFVPRSDKYLFYEKDEGRE